MLNTFCSDLLKYMLKHILLHLILNIHSVIPCEGHDGFFIAPYKTK